ncbi:MAG TPA: response regulator [Terracidiphilus sp.]|nr:response regulator [Terracidiphilus sp.]
MRPCFIILDSDFPGSISARKLVIESAKLNVITAYGQQEAIETLDRFPRVDGVVVNAEMEGRMSCREIIEKLRSVRGNIPIITVSASGHDPCDGEQFHVSSYDPRNLLSVLEQVQPACAPAINHDDEISSKKKE